MDELTEQVHPFKQLGGTARERFNMAVLTVCVIACFATGGGVGWFLRLFLNPHDFSEAQQEMISKGYVDAAEHLGEIEKVCPNGTQTKIACRLVLMDGSAIARKDDPQVANAGQPAEEMRND